MVCWCIANSNRIKELKRSPMHVYFGTMLKNKCFDVIEEAVTTMVNDIDHVFF